MPGLERRLAEPNPGIGTSSVVRGRNFPLEHSLEALAEAMKKQFPRHMVDMPGDGGPTHHVIVPAFLGREPRLYKSIDLVFAPDRKSYKFRCTRHVADKPPLASPKTPRLALAGSGEFYLAQDKKKKWIRSLLRVVRAYDRGQVSPRAVADHLANLNNEVHLGIGDKSVGPRCVVVWRPGKGSVRNDGSGHQFYTGMTRDAISPSLPTIANGMEAQAIVKVTMPHFAKMFEAARAGQPAKEPNKDEVNAEFARLPDKPDENLR